MKLNYLLKNLYMNGLKILDQIMKKKDFYKIYIDYPRTELIKRIKFKNRKND